MKSLIEQYVTKRVMEYGGIEVETPIMYDSKHPSMESYFNRFPARQYNIITDSKQLFLRFAACFGQFLMAKDFQISYKHLPLKLYELTRYSFRRESHAKALRDKERREEELRRFFASFLCILAPLRETSFCLPSLLPHSPPRGCASMRSRKMARQAPILR